ncbi:MAG TPA: TonB-dependent receptor [Longimicrobiales bacterium]|nr:TonB-dependent receptor [Longimicrobiales bacterium]
MNVDPRTRLTACALLLALSPLPVDGQERRGSAVAGVVVDAHTDHGIPEAKLVLRPLREEPGWTRGPPAWAERVTQTDARGRYRFAGLSAGPYQLEVQRSPYRSTRVRVAVPAGREANVDIGLSLEPTPERSAGVVGIVLDEAADPVPGAGVAVAGSVRSVATSSVGRFVLPHAPGPVSLIVEAVGYHPQTAIVQVPDSGAAQLVVRLRPNPVALRALAVVAPRMQPLAVATTPATLRQAPAILEPDVFRSVVLQPAVSQPNDLKGRIHLAGGSSDETAIQLDGHPLQDPFHLLGLFGAFNLSMLSRADLLIHHVPLSFDGRLSGVIDLATRHAAEGGQTELSLGVLSSGATWARRFGAVDVLASGRVTYADRLLRAFYDQLNLQDVPLFGYEDGAVRIGVDVDAWRFETLAFGTRDHFELPGDSVSLAPFSWGEVMVGTRAMGPVASWDLSVRASHSHAFSKARPRDTQEFVDSERDWYSLEVAAQRQLQRVLFDAGLELDHRRHRQAWVTRDAREIFTQRTPTAFSDRSRSSRAAGWLGGVLAAGDWRVGGGIRAVVAPGATPGGPWLAPRLVVSHAPAERWSLEGALNRRYQFEAELEEPVEGSISPPLFLLAEPRRVDVAAVSAVYTANATRARLESFVKIYPDRPVPAAAPDTPGEEVVFPDFVRIRGRSVGAAVSGVTTVRRAVLQGSYTYQRVRERFQGEWSPSGWDAPHTLVLFGSLSLGRGWSLGSAYHGHSGRAVTPIAGMTYVPAEPSAPGSLRPRYIDGERNSVRVPAYHRTDVSIQRQWRGWNAAWSLRASVVNLFRSENPIAYDWQRYFALVNAGRPPEAGRRGLPILPSVQLEVQW